jgi:two-component system, chemotaxis family, protein-glutamate methylesterase/glutaminase
MEERRPGRRAQEGEFDVVAIGASAGGVEALQALVGALPAGFPAAMLIVLHVDPHHKSMRCA